MITTKKLDWDVRRAARNLGVSLVPFDEVRGVGARGYSLGLDLAIKPSCEEPVFVALHEFAHIVLGHTTGTDNRLHTLHWEFLGIQAKEVQAHSVALALAPDLLDANDYDLEAERLYVQRAAGYDPAVLVQIVRSSEHDLKRAVRIIKAAGLK